MFCIRCFLKLAAPAAALALPGCLATTGDLRTITSEPAGALVKIEGYGECETPCTIKLDERREVTIAKAGYIAQRFGVTPGKRDVHVVLELAAPTDEVSEETLPEL